MSDTPEQIVAEIADITRRHGGRGRLYEFTPEQEAALKALGLLMHPTKEEHIVAGVLEDAKEAGWSLVRLDDCATTKRFRTHHVELRRSVFVVEHPVDCDLARCDLFERLQERWREPPGPLGWYEVDEHGAISKAQDRTTYALVPVGSGEDG